MRDAGTGIAAAQASTGQQKALLIGTILAHAALIAEARATSPILLLDEPAVHLDAARRAALFAALVALPGPALLTGTDPEMFAPLAGDAAFFTTRTGALLPA
jgi:DNA replication and repair protein RecF